MEVLEKQPEAARRGAPPVERRFLGMNPRTQLLTALAGYVGFYMALFLQFPLQNALPGNCDTVLLVALSNTFAAKLGELLGMGSAGLAMYPAENVLAYGEAAFGTGVLFLLPKLFGLSDVNAYFVFVVAVFASTATAAYLFAGLLVRSFPARLFAGFAFTCANMMFAHIDDAFHLFYALPLLSLYFLVRAIRESKTGFAYWASILGGLQIWFSIYVFIYQSVLLLGCLLYHLLWRNQTLRPRTFTLALLLYVGIAGPLFLFYSWALLDLNVVAPFEAHRLIPLLSWRFEHMLQALPGNLLYGGLVETPQTWAFMRHQNLIGVLLFASSLGALWIRGEHRILLGGTALIGLLLAMGPELYLGPRTAIPTPLYLLYKTIPLFDFHRVPIRAYFLVLLALSLLSAVALQALLEKIRSRGAVLLVTAFFFGFTFVENVPLPMRAYKLGPYLEVPASYEKFLAGKEGALILDLPSSIGLAFENWDYGLFADPAAFHRRDPRLPQLVVTDRISTEQSDQDLFHYNRDGIYLNWQTQHRRDIVGGAAGYFPATRMIFERWMEDLPGEEALRWLRAQGVDYLMYHPYMLLPGEIDILPALRSSPLLEVVEETGDLIAFRFLPHAE